MASIPEHIKNLLFEQDCVVVPDFGGFITNFHGAVVQERNGSLLPPRKRVAFNEVLKFDDGLLTSYIAIKETRSREEVLAKIRLFAEHAWRELRLRKSFRFDYLGTFTLNSEGKLVFEPDHRINFFGESYGMAPVSILPRSIGSKMEAMPVIPPAAQRAQAVLEVVPEEVVAEEVIPLNSRQRWLTLPNVAASTGVILLSLIGWIWFDGGTSTLSSLNPFAMLKIPEWKKKSVASVPIKTERNRLSQPVIEPNQPISVVENKAKPVESKPTVLAVSVMNPVKKPTEVRGLAKRVLIIPMRIRTGEGKISVPAGRYFIVVGGFGKEANAHRLQSQLKKQGFAQASLLYPTKSRLIRVAAQEFDSAPAAQQAAIESRSTLGDHIWVLKTK